MPVTVHLHGGVVPTESDGMPTDQILPGEMREYVYPNQQQAATLWYHDHAMDTTGLHCYMGMCGFYLINDEFEDALPLPKGNIPLAITDRSFNDDGSFFYPEIEGDTLLFGAMGDTILVNGARQPRLERSQPPLPLPDSERVQRASVRAGALVRRTADSDRRRWRAAAGTGRTGDATDRRRRTG